jgi:hypothetical protein
MLKVEWGFAGNFFCGFAFYVILKQLTLNGFPYHTSKLREVIFAANLLGYKRVALE